MLRFWDFAAALANSIVFRLKGSRESSQPLGNYLWAAAVGTVLVLLGRALAVYPITALFRRSAIATNRLTRHILFSGGLRGALALAAPAALPEHDALMGVAFAVVAFSIFVPGLSVPWPLRAADVEASPS
jgi:CPA1 family monovalent cation:H+ antiporter